MLSCIKIHSITKSLPISIKCIIPIAPTIILMSKFYNQYCVPFTMTDRFFTRWSCVYSFLAVGEFQSIAFVYFTNIYMPFDRCLQLLQRHSFGTLTRMQAFQFPPLCVYSCDSPPTLSGPGFFGPALWICSFQFRGGY